MVALVEVASAEVAPAEVVHSEVAPAEVTTIVASVPLGDDHDILFSACLSI